MLSAWLLALTVQWGPDGRASYAKPSRRTFRQEDTSHALVNRWVRHGTAAGHHGDYYDNRDRGHAMLRTSLFPGLGIVRYTAEQKKKRLDWGGQTTILKHVTIGNSSTSSDVKGLGSNVRAMYYLNNQGMRFLYAQYRSNNLYVYPEHRDHDPGHNGQGGYGDLFPTNSPYVIISQGSSASDMAFVQAFVSTLAAFQPQVKKRLIDTGLLMPTLQMIFRTSNRQVTHPNAYQTGIAHPTVFDPHHVNPTRMVRAAHSLRLETIPPMVQLEVVEEGPGSDSNPYFRARGSEKLADTPAVIARIVRGPAFRRRIVVSADDSYDINQRPLNYHWAVLRGDPDRIQIRTRHDGAVAEILIAYHARRRIAARAPIASNRVDIGVFVDNGATISAPGFVTFYGLDNEWRTYDQDQRLVEVYYSADDQHLHIINWPALLRAVTSDPDDLPGQLLHEALGPDDRAAIAKLEVAMGPALIRLGNAKTSEHAADVKHRQVLTSLRSRQSAWKRAQTAYQRRPNEHTKATLDQAKAAHQAMTKREKDVQQALRGLRE